MPALLNTSDAAAIALHASARLAASPGRRLSNREIAEDLGVSRDHHYKVQNRLAAAGLTETRRGPAGGFMLAKPPADITLREVLEAISGPIDRGTCLLSNRICGNNRCMFGDTLENIGREVRRHLGRTTLADAADVFSRKHPKTTRKEEGR
jgi:Rrf2 family protein